MSKDPKFHTVAKAVRLERIQETDEVFIVFQVIDEMFKQRIQNNWEDDVELKLVVKEKDCNANV